MEDSGIMTGASGGADPGALPWRDDSLSRLPRLFGRYRWSEVRSGAYEGCAPGRGTGVDPIVAAFGTALVGAIATDGWQQVREAVTGLWRRVHPQPEGNGIGAELDELRDQVLVARRDGDAGVERALEGAWQLRLAQLLRADPALAA